MIAWMEREQIENPFKLTSYLPILKILNLFVFI